MNEKLEQAKEIIARQHGFKSWKGIIINLPSLNSDKIISQVAERYHELMSNDIQEQIDNAYELGCITASDDIFNRI